MSISKEDINYYMSTLAMRKIDVSEDIKGWSVSVPLYLYMTGEYRNYTGVELDIIVKNVIRNININLGYEKKGWLI